jgi:hypothetical protein
MVLGHIKTLLIRFKVFGLNRNVRLHFLEHIKTFWFRSDNYLRYRNVSASVLVSLTLLLRIRGEQFLFFRYQKIKIGNWSIYVHIYPLNSIFPKFWALYETLLTENISLCAFFILSASTENTRKVFRHLRRMRGKYLTEVGVAPMSSARRFSAT